MKIERGHPGRAPTQPKTRAPKGQPHDEYTTEDHREQAGLLNLAEELGKVSRACKVVGYSRDTFCRYELPVDEGILLTKGKIPALEREKLDDETFGEIETEHPGDRRRWKSRELSRLVRWADVDAVEHERMEMRRQVDHRAEALEKRGRAARRSRHSVTNDT